MRTRVVILCILGVAIGVFVAFGARAKVAGRAQRVDLGGLAPGLRATVPMGDLAMDISVPEGEGHTGGTFRVTVPKVGFDSGVVARHGTLEAAWVVDVNQDEILDAVLVVRGGGSGSYASIVIVESSAGSFDVIHLPPVSSTRGYMGHDEVHVREGRIIRSFPSYEDHSPMRVRRQRNAGRGTDRESSPRARPDPNASPSGKTVRLAFDRATGSWQESP